MRQKESRFDEITNEIKKSKPSSIKRDLPSKQWIVSKLRTLVGLLNTYNDRVKDVRLELHSIFSEQIVITPTRLKSGWKIKARVRANLMNHIGVPLPTTDFSGTGK